MTKRLSLRARLRRVIIVTGISFYLLASLIVAAVEIKKKRSDYASAMITTVKTCEAIIIDYINQYHEYIQHVIAKMPNSAEPVVINYFRENLHFQNLRDMYYILDYHNRIIHIQKPYEQYQGINLSHIEHISEKIPVSKVHQSLFSQQPVVSFLYPLAGNKLLVLEKDLKGIVPLAEHFNLGEILKGGYLFILSANGTVVYHPASQLIDSRHNLGFELTDWSDPDARGLQTFTYHDKKYLCYRITLEKPIGWALYFVVPNAVLFRAIIYHVAQIFLIFAAVFSFLIFFLQLIMNKKLSKPVSEIVTSISTCNLDGTDEPIPQSKASGTKELTSIIDAINNMMAELNRSNENLRESEQRHRTLIETMTDGVFTLDTNGRFTFLNPEFEKLVGYSVQDFIGHSFSEILAPEYIESTGDRFRRGLSGETIPMYEVEVIHKYGKRISIELNVTSLLDAHGNPIGRIGVARDISERKAAEKALRKSEQEKAAILGSMTEHIVYHDTEHKVLWANRAAGESVGFTPEQLVGRHCYEIWQQRTKPCIGCPVEKTIETGQLQEAEMTTPDGRAWFIRGNPVRDVNGNIIGGLETTLEITKHKRAEEALRASETLKKAILDASIDRIRLVDTDMRILWANKTTARELNMTPEGLVGQYCYKVFVGRDSPCTECPTKEALKSGNIEHTILHQPYSKGIKGETYWDAYAVPIKNESGDIVNCIQVARNITDSKKAEEALRESEERLKTILDSLQAGIVLIDPVTHTIVDANPAAIEMIGAPKEQIIGHVCHKYICPAEKGKCPITDLGQKVDTSERTLLTATGAEVPILKTVTPILLSSQAHLLDIFIDITEKKELEAQLQQAQKMEAIGTLAGGIAHDFNNILQTISGYTQILLMGKEADNPDYEKLEAIEKSAQRASDLTKQLLIFSRKVESKLRPIDLNKETEQISKMLERTIPKMINIELHLAENLNIVNADPAQIEQILMNIGVNARDAMPNGGRLIFETENIILDEHYCKIHLGSKPGHYVKLSISDTGHGMDKETLKHIFDPFYTTKETGKGTGLGLAMVYGIVKSHNGYIMCYSEPGVGTTFKIYFPVIKKETENLEPKEEQFPIKGGNETILLVDDEEAIRELGKDVLAKFGYTVLMASDGETALEIYRERKEEISLVILDIIMPGMGGRKCLEELLKINPELRVIIASGYSMNGPSKEVLKAGAKGFISKPYNINQILKAVRETLDN